MCELTSVLGPSLYCMSPKCHIHGTLWHLTVITTEVHTHNTQHLTPHFMVTIHDNWTSISINIDSLFWYKCQCHPFHSSARHPYSTSLSGGSTLDNVHQHDKLHIIYSYCNTVQYCLKLYDATYACWKL